MTHFIELVFKFPFEISAIIPLQTVVLVLFLRIKICQSSINCINCSNWNCFLCQEMEALHHRLQYSPEHLIISMKFIKIGVFFFRNLVIEATNLLIWTVTFMVILYVFCFISETSIKSIYNIYQSLNWYKKKIKNKFNA